ncbi:hypothetical protein DDV21_003725 [Streptococcus chenjunshii]|uniref:Uncharacterized protein n=1 Tax=Streptococcus chenjunshii TaxID=2173853 RepID=A0A372KK84_9STRE|nr:hypothetical protein DDV21_003725 [Streptococcus chenjunshii]RFU50464.1 hypothetical protein DDV22_08625 [Streptococcus chenjunshii]RFU52680.1 hypothetical protein DDV23_08400 [Streptococcus chenjunshii]
MKLTAKTAQAHLPGGLTTLPKQSGSAALRNSSLSFFLTVFTLCSDCFYGLIDRLLLLFYKKVRKKASLFPKILNPVFLKETCFYSI